jgi:UDP-2,3-diacylglucosamine pyrophosphatase LpxH
LGEFRKRATLFPHYSNSHITLTLASHELAILATVIDSGSSRKAVTGREPDWNRGIPTVRVLLLFTPTRRGNMRHFDTVVVSDLHLGARNSRTYEFLEFLSTVKTNHLIINGDLFEDPRLRGLRDCDIAVLDALRRYARHTELTLLRGNHDPEPAWYNGVLGIPVFDEYLLNVAGREYLIYHGHGWDKSMELPAVVIAIADAFYAGSQWIDPSHRFAKFLKRKCKTFCKAVKNMRNRALAVAEERQLTGVITGHTHIQEDDWYGGTHYINSGCWTEKPSGFIGIRRNEIRTYQWTISSRREIPEPVALPNYQDLFPSEWELAGT